MDRQNTRSHNRLLDVLGRRNAEETANGMGRMMALNFWENLPERSAKAEEEEKTDVHLFIHI